GIACRRPLACTPRCTALQAAAASSRGGPGGRDVKLRTRLGSPAIKGLAALVAAGLVAAGCSSDTSDKGSSQGGGTLVVGYTAEPNTLDPWKATQFQAVHLLEQVYGTLTQLDKDLNVVPGLAEKWEYSDDNTTLSMTLREG